MLQTGKLRCAPITATHLLAQARSLFLCLRNPGIKPAIGAKRIGTLPGVKMKRMTSNQGFAADANQGVRALEVSLLLLLIAYLHSVLAPLFPNFVLVVHDVNRLGAGKGGVGSAKGER